ncbi:MAG: BspA family leucine-rich repeat surface protein [Anaerovoracaceae bacterium]|jgi:uncharacterized repeat protein (TIGR02543 family)
MKEKKLKKIPALILSVLLVLTMMPLLPGAVPEAHAVDGGSIPEGYCGETVSYSVRSFIPTPQDYKFEKVSGPDWLTVSEDGDVTGTRPDRACEAATLHILAEYKYTDKYDEKDIYVTVGAVKKPPADYSGKAYAVRSQDGSTLWFIRSKEDVTDGTHTTITSISGGSYTGTVYADIETIPYEMPEDIFSGSYPNTVPKWYTYGDKNIRKAVFVDYIRPRSTACWFYMKWALTEIDSIYKLDTSNVTNMEGMFGFCMKMTELDLSGFDTSRVTNMVDMFRGCKVLPSLDVSGFDTSRVTDMRGMFDECRALKTLDFGNFDTSSVTNMWGMFSECTALEEVDLSSFDTSNVTATGTMFFYAKRLKALDLSGFDLSKNKKTTIEGYTGYWGLKQMFDGACLESGPVTGYAADKANAAKLNSKEYTYIDNSKLRFVAKSPLSFNVYLHYNDGTTPVKKMTRAAGKAMTLPVPKRAGYSFGGWFHEASLSGGAVTTIASGAVGTRHYHAKWVPSASAVTVSFNSRGGSKITPLAVEKGTAVNRPADPARSGYTFEGWYRDKACKKAYDFKTKVTGNITLYAKWNTPKQNTAAVVKKLSAVKDNKEPAGSAYRILRLRTTKVGKKNITLRWNKVKGASKYIVFANRCGKKYKYKAMKQTKKTTLNVKKVAKKKLQKGKYYKFFVAAIRKNGKTIRVSKTMHVATTGGKAGNFRSVKVTKARNGAIRIDASKITSEKDRYRKLKVKTVKQPKKKVSLHRRIRYESSDTSVATVNSRGTIRLRGLGICYIYAYAQDGHVAKVKVVVYA